MHPSDPNYVVIPGQRRPGLGAVIFTSMLTSGLVSALTVFGLLRFGGGDAFALLFDAPAAQAGDPVRVPDVLGMAAESADELLSARDLRFVVEARRPDATAAAGTVIGQTPLAQSRIDPGAEVAVVLSTGPDRIEVPDVLGKPIEEAQREVEAAGLKVGPLLEVDSGEPGTVASITPQPGTAVEHGAIVSIAVAKAKIAVPKLLGDHIRDARARLKKAGLAVGNVSEIYDRRRRGNLVLSQDPDPGSGVPIGTPVDLVINQGD